MGIECTRCGKGLGSQNNKIPTQKERFYISFFLQERPLCASGQAEGHEDTGTVQRPHVQVWNYDTLDLLHLVGLDDFSDAVTAVAFTSKRLGGEEEDAEGPELLLAAIEAQEKPELSVWSGVGEGGEPRMVARASAASHEVTSLGFLPGAADKLVSAGHGHVAMWEVQDGEGDDKKLDKSQVVFDSNPNPI